MPQDIFKWVICQFCWALLKYTCQTLSWMALSPHQSYEFLNDRVTASCLLSFAITICCWELEQPHQPLLYILGKKQLRWLFAKSVWFLKEKKMLGLEGHEGGGGIVCWRFKNPSSYQDNSYLGSSISNCRFLNYSHPSNWLLQLQTLWLPMLQLPDKVSEYTYLKCCRYTRETHQINTHIISCQV